MRRCDVLFGFFFVLEGCAGCCLSMFERVLKVYEEFLEVEVLLCGN